MTAAENPCRFNPKVTHSSPNRRLLPTKSCRKWLTHIHLAFSRSPPIAASRIQGFRRQSTLDEPTEPSPHHTTPRIIWTTNKWKAHAEDASQGQADPSVADRDGGAHLGVTAKRSSGIPIASPRSGSSIIDAWSSKGHCARRVRPSRVRRERAPDASMRACRRNDPSIQSGHGSSTLVVALDRLLSFRDLGF